MPKTIFGMRPGLVLFALIVLYSIGPILSVLFVTVVANALGCQVDEGGVHPCLCCGVDIGRLLHSMGVLGWLALVTLPTGAMALVTCAIVLGGVAIGNRRRREAADEVDEAPPS